MTSSSFVLGLMLCVAGFSTVHSKNPTTVAAGNGRAAGGADTSVCGYTTNAPTPTCPQCKQFATPGGLTSYNVQHSCGYVTMSCECCNLKKDNNVGMCGITGSSAACPATKSFATISSLLDFTESNQCTYTSLSIGPCP